jgi:hypothetical protein
MKRCLLAALLVLPLLGSGSPKEYDDKTKRNGIIGIWKVVKTENCGTEMTSSGADEVIFDEVHVTYKRESAVIIAGTYKVDSQGTLEFPTKSGH